MRFPLQGAVVLETSYISLDDRFAAQIVLSLRLWRRDGVIAPYHCLRLRRGVARLWSGY